MPNFTQPIVCKHTNKFDMGLIHGAGWILIGPLVGITVVGLGMLAGKFCNLVFVNQHLSVFIPDTEFWQRFAVVIFADSGVKTIVPAMHSTDQVIASNMAVGHQRTAMGTAPIEHSQVVVVTYEDQINLGNQ